MHNYDALRDFLARQSAAELTLTFAQIEDIIGGALPRAAQRASWWDSTRSPQEKMPQREACLAANYVAVRMADADSVKFRRPRKSFARR